MYQVEKKDFSQKNLLELQLNKSIIVQCSNFKEMESSCNMASLVKKRFPELGRTFRTEQDTDLNRLLITRLT